MQVMTAIGASKGRPPACCRVPHKPHQMGAGLKFQPWLGVRKFRQFQPYISIPTHADVRYSLAMHAVAAAAISIMDAVQCDGV